MTIFRKAFLTFFILLITKFCYCQSSTEMIYKNPDAPIEERVNDLLRRMTLEEKIEQVSGLGFAGRVNERLDIPPFLIADGPVGVRWEEATAFPAAVALASSWDEDLMLRVGKIMGIETKAMGRNYLLGPCVNMHRFPIGGRNFESYGEDPYLAGKIAANLIRGIQSVGTIANVKHFACNNQEWQRSSVNAIVDERTLREIYLPAFKTAVVEGDVWSVMTSYNKLNGEYTSENQHLITDILKKDWGFDGFVVSDWGAVHSTVPTIKSGLDLEMPFGDYLGEELIKNALRKNEITTAMIDEMVRRILRIKFKAGLFEEQEIIAKDIYKSDVHKSIALETARKGIVLLKNENKQLPLSKKGIKKIAVVGPNAAYARTGGGGSSKVTPYYSVSPLDGIKTNVGDEVEVLYALGAVTKNDIQIIEAKYFSHLENGVLKPGLLGEYYDNISFNDKPFFSRVDKEVNNFWCYDAPSREMHGEDDESYFSVRWSGLITPPITGEYGFELIRNQSVKLSIDDEVILNESGDHYRGIVDKVKYFFKAGISYKIVLEYVNNAGVSEIKLGWRIPNQDLIKEAADIARQADVAVVCVGLSDHFESEGRDREFLSLDNQNKLIQEVSKVNPNTIVVIISGTQIIMQDWIDNVPSVLQAWYGGQEGGNAIAAVLFGSYNPSGKLPCTFYREVEDSPGFLDYKDESLISNYSEGLFIGYRHVDKNSIDVEFPFGHGLSYTEFDYKSVNASFENNNIVVEVVIENTGSVSGREAVQLYVQDTESTVVRPVKELKDFVIVDLEPGEKRKIEFVLNEDDFSYYDVIKGGWILESGAFKILIGSSSQDIRLWEEIFK